MLVKKINSILLSERCRVDKIEKISVSNMEEEIHELLVNKDLSNEDRKIPVQEILLGR